VKQPIVQLRRNFPTFYRTRRFITVFTRTLSTGPYPEPDQSSQYHPNLSHLAHEKGSAVVSSIYLWLYSPSLALGRFFSFLIFYTVGRILWMGDQSVARPLPTYRINAHRHPCLKWHSNSRSQYFSGRTQCML
jgi:hypothetical protein